MKESIVSDGINYCFLCGAESEAKHHLLSGNVRKLADEDGLYVGICNRDHNMYNGKPSLGQKCDMHGCRKLEALGKMLGQLAWEKNYYRKKLNASSDHDEAREAFLRRYGKKFL